VVEIRVCADPGSLAVAAAEHFVALAQEAVTARGVFCVALSGGSTPRAAYALLATEEYAVRVDWGRVQVFWGDERCVSPDHMGSNYRMAREVLLDHVSVPQQNVHRLRGESCPGDVAALYEVELRKVFRVGVPHFDLVMLGMGQDGHTASLFPGTEVLDEQRRWVVAHYVDSVQGWRVTLSPLVINAARNVTFIVSGTDKSDVMREVLEGPSQPYLLPARLVNPDEGHLLWLLDEEAAALLEQ